MKKGYQPVGEGIQWIGLVLISLLLLYVIIDYASEGAHVQRAIETGSLIYTIASASNSLSTVEEGEIVRYLRNIFDIKVRCDSSERCFVTTAPYDKQGKLIEESKQVLILGNIEPVYLQKTNKIILTKQPGKKVVLRGEWIADLLGTEFPIPVLNIPQYQTMCINDARSASYAEYIKDASSLFTVDEELIAAVITAESSWDDQAYRYEPFFQIRYLEGNKEWTSNENWLNEGQTIQEWFERHPERKNDYTEFQKEYPNKLVLIAQTRVSASYGLMQIMYPTAKESCDGAVFDISQKIIIGNTEDLKSPRTNILCGTKILKDKLNQYSRNQYRIADAVSAYNAGKSRWTENMQNKQYTEKVLGYYDAFKSCKV